MMNKFEIKKFKRITYNSLLKDEIEKKIIKWSKTKKNKKTRNKSKKKLEDNLQFWIVRLN
jgi:hypothetical protein